MTNARKPRAKSGRKTAEGQFARSKGSARNSGVSRVIPRPTTGDDAATFEAHPADDRDDGVIDNEDQR